MNGPIAVVSNFEGERVAEGTLHAEVPGFRIRLGERLIQTVNGRGTQERELGFWATCLVCLRREAERRKGIPQREASGSERSGLAGVIRVEEEELVVERTVVGRCVPEVLVRFGEAAQGKSAANDCSASAQDRLPGAVRGLGIPRKTDRGLGRHFPWIVRIGGCGDRRVHVALE